MDSLNWLNDSGRVSMSFVLRVAVMVLSLLCHYLAYKMIRRGIFIWEDFQVLCREDEGRWIKVRVVGFGI